MSVRKTVFMPMCTCVYGRGLPNYSTPHRVSSRFPCVYAHHPVYLLDSACLAEVQRMSRLFVFSCQREKERGGEGNPAISISSTGLPDVLACRRIQNAQHITVQTEGEALSLARSLFLNLFVSFCRYLSFSFSLRLFLSFCCSLCLSHFSVLW